MPTGACSTTSRKLKFPLTGAVGKHDITLKAAIAVVIGLLLTRFRAVLAAARPSATRSLSRSVANAMPSVSPLALAYPVEHYLNFGIG